jgi:hypothetical protein
MHNAEQSVGDVLFSDSSPEAKTLIDSIDRLYIQEIGKVTESAEELGHGYGIALDRARSSPRLAGSIEFFSVDFNWLDRVEERERLGNLEHSELPGLHELHLRWCINNPLFPKDRREVTQEDIYVAVLKDDEDSRAFRETAAKFWADFQAFDKSRLTSGVLLEMREKADLLIEQGVAIGPIAQKAVGGLEKIRELVMNALRAIFPPEEIEKLSLAENYYQKNAPYVLNPFVGMSLRTDSPITKETFLPALLSQRFAVILSFMGGLDETNKDITKKVGERLLRAAEEEGYRNGEKIRLAFELS